MLIAVFVRSLNRVKWKTLGERISQVYISTWNGVWNFVRLKFFNVSESLARNVKEAELSISRLASSLWILCWSAFSWLHRYLWLALALLQISMTPLSLTLKLILLLHILSILYYFPFAEIKILCIFLIRTFISIQ